MSREADRLLLDLGYVLVMGRVRKRRVDTNKYVFYVTIPADVVRKLGLSGGELVEIWMKVRGGSGA